MTTKIKDLETIIEIQEKIIESNKKENDILEDCLKKSYEREDNMKQWAFWYRAFSEYLEQCIQVFIKTKKKTIDRLNALKSSKIEICTTNLAKNDEGLEIKETDSPTKLVHKKSLISNEVSGSPKSLEEAMTHIDVELDMIRNSNRNIENCNIPPENLLSNRQISKDTEDKNANKNSKVIDNTKKKIGSKRKVETSNVNIEVPNSTKNRRKSVFFGR